MWAICIEVGFYSGPKAYRKVLSLKETRRIWEEHLNASLSLGKPIFISPRWTPQCLSALASFSSIVVP